MKEDAVVKQNIQERTAVIAHMDITRTMDTAMAYSVFVFANFIVFSAQNPKLKVKNYVNSYGLRFKILYLSGSTFLGEEIKTAKICFI